MSGMLLALTGTELVRIFGRSGFAVVRVRGSHHSLGDCHGPADRLSTEEQDRLVDWHPQQKPSACGRHGAGSRISV